MAPKHPATPWLVGDRVHHVEGGPEMKITRIVGQTVWCTWNANNRTHTRVLPAEEIYRASRDGDCAAFEVGMIVQHLSGGPRMRVTEKSDGWAWCEWVTNSHPQSRRLPCNELIEIVQANQ